MNGDLETGIDPFCSMSEFMTKGLYESSIFIAPHCIIIVKTWSLLYLYCYQNGNDQVVS